MRSASLVATCLLAACTSPDPFRCEISDQCARGDERGVCQPIGHCSFADPGCESGQRYDGSASEDLAGTCVGEELPCEGEGCATVGCVTQIAAGDDHTCAVLELGRVECWGSGTYGKLGNGTASESQAEPGPVQGSMHVATAVDAGPEHTCAVADAQAWCWGDGSNGKLGDGTEEDRLLPNPVALGDRVSEQIGVGNRHACAVDDSGRLHCWGDNNSFQIGDPTGSVPNH
jgi:hypothetical protein